MGQFPDGAPGVTRGAGAAGSELSAWGLLFGRFRGFGRGVVAFVDRAVCMAARAAAFGARAPTLPPASGLDHMELYRYIGTTYL